MYMAMLPPKLLPPRSRPPPVTVEICASGLLKRARYGSCILHSDGAQAYPSAVKSYKGLKHRAVSHKNMQFTRPARSVALPHGRRSSTLVGTQAIDATWRSLDKSIPAQLHTKHCHRVHPLLEEHMWSWLFRVNCRNMDGFKTMGGYIKKAASA